MVFRGFAIVVTIHRRLREKLDGMGSFIDGVPEATIVEGAISCYLTGLATYP